MTSMPGRPSAKLERLASLYSVQTSYIDAAGRKRRSTTDSLLRILRLRGAELARESEVDSALRARKEHLRSRLMDPVHVVWEGDPFSVPIRMSRPERTTVRYELELENGERRLGTAELVAGRAGGTVTIREPLPFGYHRLRLIVRRKMAEAALISAPRKAYAPWLDGEKRWGAFVPAYALHSVDAPEASTGNLGEMSRWIGEQGGQICGTLPILAAFLDEPFEASPYSPVSRLFWNEFYVDVRSLPEMAESPRRDELLRSLEAMAVGQRDPKTTQALVDYRLEMKARRAVLETLLAQFIGTQGERKRSFDAFAGGNVELGRYARFRAVCDQRRTPWTSWPENLKNGVIAEDDFEVMDEQYHLYVQWLMSEQMKEIATRSAGKANLYLDFPLGVNPSGYDVWSRPHLFNLNVSAGAPPDPFFTRGQSWGFPPLDPDAIRESGHEYFIRSIRHQLRHAEMLRIDHVMGLHRLFWVPEGAEAADGTYVRYPADELFAILCLESLRHRSVIVGEDLGTVPPEVRQLMDDHAVARMFVVQYELNPKAEPVLSDPSPAMVASMNTHDMPTFYSFWTGRDIDDRVKLGLLDERSARKERKARAAIRSSLAGFLNRKGFLAGPSDEAEDILRGCLRILSRSEAYLLLINLEDLWLEVEPQNTPGTGPERANWRRKLRYTLDEIKSSQSVASYVEQIGRRD